MSKMKSKVAHYLCIALLGTAASAAELPDQADTKHMGVATCAASQCHGSAVPRDGSNVLQNEYVTWTRDDPHAKAHATLDNDLSRAIAMRLGLPSASKADLCLDCHADNVATGLRGEQFQVSDGVGCESCHGGAEGWLSTHYAAAPDTHAQSLAQGLYPTDDIAARAALCLGCHLGTRDKFATHQMMAAGHPRLAFELDTFTELWRTAGRQPHYRIDADYEQRKDSASPAVAWSVGLIADARRRLALVTDSPFFADSLFPELGLYDCHACHRSMKSVEWRPLERHGGAGPGVPFLNDGTLVMTLALCEAVAPDLADELRTALGQLHASASGDSRSLKTAAHDVDELLQRISAMATASTLQNRQREILRKILASAAAGNFLDYASAEQAFMAVQMLAIDLDDARLEGRLDELAETLADDERYQPAQFAALLESLD